MPKKRTTKRRKCKICKAPEKISTSTGLTLSNMSPYSCICAKCINTHIMDRQIVARLKSFA